MRLIWRSPVASATTSTTHHLTVPDPAGTIIRLLQKALDVATEVEAEPMHPIDFQDLEHCPRKVTESA